jgi:hypothetical protein
MRFRIKAFTSYQADAVEREANEWLADHEDCAITYISATYDIAHGHTLFIACEVYDNLPYDPIAHQATVEAWR